MFRFGPRFAWLSVAGANGHNGGGQACSSTIASFSSRPALSIDPFDVEFGVRSRSVASLFSGDGSCSLCADSVAVFGGDPGRNLAPADVAVAAAAKYFPKSEETPGCIV